MSNPSVQGFVRGLLIVLLASAVDYVGTHIGFSGLVSGGTATVIAGICMAIEHSITGTQTAASRGMVTK